MKIPNVFSRLLDLSTILISSLGIYAVYVILSSGNIFQELTLVFNSQTPHAITILLWVYFYFAFYINKVGRLAIFPIMFSFGIGEIIDESWDHFLLGYPFNISFILLALIIFIGFLGWGPKRLRISFSKPDWRIAYLTYYITAWIIATIFLPNQISNIVKNPVEGNLYNLLSNLVYIPLWYSILE